MAAPECGPAGEAQERLRRLNSGFSDRDLARPMLREIADLAARIARPVRIMEVCGTHTVALRRHGIHSLLPRGGGNGRRGRRGEGHKGDIRLISGPGCPVCVTPSGYIDRALELLRHGEVRIATFGDMVRVPGSGGDCLHRHLGGGRVKVVYSPAEAVALAASSPGPVVFLGIGFETTSPTVAAAFLQAAERGLRNLLLYPAFKTIPQALRALLASPRRALDGLLLPGHVSAIIGPEAYRFLEEENGAPAVITGFEPLDLLAGILGILRQLADGRRQVENAYPRAVRPGGNPKAREVLYRFLEPGDALWRGLGAIPGSGLEIRPEYGWMDAGRRFGLPAPHNEEPEGCRCAQVIQGQRVPTQCPLFGRRCTPESPVGPCMVSSEGSCAAWYRYGEEDGR